MARVAAPEGAKKLYIDEKLFKKIEKQTAEYAAAKKASKKDAGAEACDRLDVAKSDLAQTLAGNWEKIKLASGIKPELPVVKKGRGKKVEQEMPKARKPQAGSGATRYSRGKKVVDPAKAGEGKAPGEV